MRKGLRARIIVEMAEFAPVVPNSITSAVVEASELGKALVGKNLRAWARL
jgi:hypothetical protein